MEGRHPLTNNISTSATEELLKKQLTRELDIALGSCVRCGICCDTCHYYAAKPRLEHMPAYRGEVVRRLYKRLSNAILRRFRRLPGPKNGSESLDSLAEVAFASCTMCGRCAVNCPMGVNNALLMDTARSIVTAMGKAPEMLVQLADTSITRGDNLELFRDILMEQLKALEDEVRQQTGDAGATIPVERKGARSLFVALSGSHTIIPPAILFHHAKADWTLSLFEASNYGFFLGDTERARRITQRIVDEAKRLEVEEVVIGECGHAYNALRWEAPKWFGEAFPFRVRSILEVLDEYVREGRLRLDPSRNAEPVTYHDPCNLGRKGGLFEEPRRIIRAAAMDFREMIPNREQNFCCGGGGGLVAIPEWNEIRLQAGKPKADQIRRTGAKIVITPCDNCQLQINELNEYYGLDIKVSGVSELVVNALAS
jgi:Fe-S oxidoreductase